MDSYRLWKHILMKLKQNNQNCISDFLQSQKAYKYCVVSFFPQRIWTHKMQSYQVNEWTEQRINFKLYLRMHPIPRTKTVSTEIRNPGQRMHMIWTCNWWQPLTSPNSKVWKHAWYSHYLCNYCSKSLSLLSALTLAYHKTPIIRKATHLNANNSILYWDIGNIC